MRSSFGSCRGPLVVLSAAAMLACAQTNGSDGGASGFGGAAGSDAGEDGLGPKEAGPGCEADLDSDPKNCGGCGLDCAGGDCLHGVCTPTAVSTGILLDTLAKNGHDVYWTSRKPDPSGDGFTFPLWSSKPGAEPLQLVELEDRGLHLNVDDGVMHMVDATSITRFTLPGFAQTVIASVGASGAGYLGFAEDAESLYFASQHVYRVNKTSGAVATLCGAWLPQGLAVTDDAVFFADYDGLFRVSKSGGSPALVVDQDVSGVAADQSYVFYTGSIENEPEHGLYRVDPATPGSERIASIGKGRRLALDDDYVYVTDTGDWPSQPQGRVLRVSKHDGATLVVGTDDYGPWDVIATESAVFWIAGDNGSRTLWRWVKPPS